MHGFPRATKDVGYLVGNEAFERTEPILVYRDELKDRIKMGVVDLLSVPTEYPCLADQLAVPGQGELNVIAPEALILMKLSANRPQDRADVSRLLDAGIDEQEVASYLADNAPNLLNRFAEIAEAR
jgi:hypothetical protein